MRQPLYLRLRPFLRRELRAKFVSALFTVLVLLYLSWLGISALTRIDSREAHELRSAAGLENRWSVCGGPGGPGCAYEDREQARVDAKFSAERRLRLAVLDELAARIDHASGALNEAQRLIEAAKVGRRNGAIEGDTVELRRQLELAIVDLRPAPVMAAENRRERLLWPLDAAMPEIPHNCATLAFDGIGWVDGCDLTKQAGQQPADQRRLVLEQVARERQTLAQVAQQISELRGRDGADEPAAGAANRSELVEDILPDRHVPSDYGERMQVAAWLAVVPGDIAPGDDGAQSSLVGAAKRSGMTAVNDALVGFARHHVGDLARAIQDPGGAIWHGGWLLQGAERLAITKPTERYRSPITNETRARLLGTVLLLLGGLLLVLVGPVVTATATAREREAGTLPVLRMTGLTAGDLALAMTVGPNVFALVAGGVLVLCAAPILMATAGFTATVTAMAVILAMSAATHLTAIGLGDALGQRVNAIVVGGLLGLGVLLPGLVGGVMVVGDMAATGLLLGPLPATITEVVRLSGLPYATLMSHADTSEMAHTMLAYGLFVQGALGFMCLMSWRRRVEQPWAPLFRPIEGAVLGLASVGCSALAVLDLSQQIHVQTYDQVNLITFVSTGFLMPVLSWLLVSSLVRPARAAAVASYQEVRRGFARFQIFVLLTAAALAGAYMMVLERSGLGSEKSEIMWATIAQGLLIAETSVAALLLASRRREGKHRVLVLGAAIVVMQLALTAGVYNLEVEHVALTQTSGMPLLLGMDASPYWVAFLVVLWSAGLGLVLAALLRERDRARADTDADSPSGNEGDDEGDGSEKQRWLH